MVKYAVLDTMLLYSVIVSANTILLQFYIVVNSSIYNTHLDNNLMKFTIELDTDHTLIDNLNTIEDVLRTQGIMSNTDNLVAITDNPLHDESITLRDDVVLTAVGNQISVLPNASVTVQSDVEDE